METGYGVDWKGREEFTNIVNWGRMKDEVHCVPRCEALTGESRHWMSGVGLRGGWVT